MNIKINKIYTRQIRISLNYDYIEDTINIALKKYPVLADYLYKIDVDVINKNFADAVAKSFWKKHWFYSECMYKICIDKKFLFQKHLNGNNIKGILWHEIGHILSVYCYIGEDGFFVNKKVEYLKTI